MNAIWNQLKEKMDVAAMEVLTAEELEWIAYKEAEIQKAGAGRKADESAVQSYRVLAFDYLLKPVTAEAMAECLSRFTKLVPDKRFLSIDYMGVRTNILLSNIVYLESELRKVIFHLSGKKSIIITAKLEDFPNLNDEPDFCRCHKSFLVNLNYVDAISGENFCLPDGKLLRISRTFSSGAKKAYFDYVFGKGGTQNGI